MSERRARERAEVVKVALETLDILHRMAESDLKLIRILDGTAARDRAAEAKAAALAECAAAPYKPKWLREAEAADPFAAAQHQRKLDRIRRGAAK